MVWGSFLIAAAALKTPTRNGYNAQGVNLRTPGGYFEFPAIFSFVLCWTRSFGFRRKILRRVLFSTFNVVCARLYARVLVPPNI